MQNRDFYAMADRDSAAAETVGVYDSYIRIKAGPDSIGHVIDWLAEILKKNIVFLDVLVPGEGDPELLHLTPDRDADQNMAELGRLRSLVTSDTALAIAASIQGEPISLESMPEGPLLPLQIASYEKDDGGLIHISARTPDGRVISEVPMDEFMDEPHWVPYEEPRGDYYANRVLFRFRMARRTDVSEAIVELIERFAADFLGTVNNVEDVYEEHSSAFEIIASGYLSFGEAEYPAYVKYLEEMMKLMHNHPEVSWDIRNIMWEHDTCEFIAFRLDDEKPSVEAIRLSLID